MINAERINSQLSLSCEKAIASVDPWGGGGGGLTIDMERINSRLSLSREKVIAFVDRGGGGGGLTPPRHSVPLGLATSVKENSGKCGTVANKCNKKIKIHA